MSNRKKLYYRFRWLELYNGAHCANGAIYVSGTWGLWTHGNFALKASRKRFCKESKADARKGRLYLSRRHRKQGHPLQEIALADLRGFNSKGLLWLIDEVVF